MAISTKYRWYVYFAALAVALVAARWAGGQNRELTPVSPPAASSGVRRDPEVSPHDPELQLNILGKRVHLAASADPFQGRSWEPAMGTRQGTVAVPPPLPPPLPFTYIGKLVDRGAVTVFLSDQDRNYIVRAGDTLHDTYVVEAVEDQRLVLKYLPLGVRQALPLGAEGGASPEGPLDATRPRPTRMPPQPGDEDDDGRS